MFRKLMAVDMMPSYKPFKALNRNVIQPAMKEVNKLSNIQIEMETRMKGRSVTGLRFLIRPNPQLSLVGMEEDDDITSSPAYEALLKEGVSKTLARHWVIEHGEEHIFDKLDLAHDQAVSGKIRSSKAGFLRAAIEEDFHNENAAKKKRLAEAEEAKRTRAQLEARLDSLRVAHRKAESLHRGECVKIIEEVFQGLSEAQGKAVAEEFRLGLSSKIFADSFRKNGWSDRMTYSEAVKFWQARGIALPSPAEVAQKNSSQEPLALKVQIEELEKQLKQLVV